MQTNIIIYSQSRFLKSQLEAGAGNYEDSSQGETQGESWIK